MWGLVKGETLYVLFEQKNGDFLLGWGHYVTKDGEMSFCDIRILFKLEVAKKDIVESAEEYLPIYDAYYCYDSKDPMTPSLILDPVDMSFYFNFSAFSSYFAMGSYSEEGNIISCSTSDGQYIYRFVRQEDETGVYYVFDGEDSSEIPRYRVSGESSETYCPVEDGAVFRARMSRPIDMGYGEGMTPYGKG
jgi:hypothetical protein